MSNRLELPGIGFVVGEDGWVGFCAEGVKMNGHDSEENEAAKKGGEGVVELRAAFRRVERVEGEGREGRFHESTGLWSEL